MTYVNVKMWNQIAKAIKEKNQLKHTQVEEIKEETIVDNTLPFPLDINGEPIVPAEYLKADVAVETPVVVMPPVEPVVEQPVMAEETVVETVEQPVENIVEEQSTASEETPVETPKKRGRKSKQSEIVEE